MWIVQANVVVNRSGDSRLSFQVPTFFLDPNIQGIADQEHAESIARAIINPMHFNNWEVYPNCVRMNP